jgi:hypothetical protein
MILAALHLINYSGDAVRLKHRAQQALHQPLAQRMTGDRSRSRSKSKKVSLDTMCRQLQKEVIDAVVCIIKASSVQI